MPNGFTPSGPNSVAVLPTVAEAFRLIFRNFGVVVSLGTVPMVLSILWPMVLRVGTGPHELKLILAAAGELFFFSVFSVAWHRHILLGRRDTNMVLQFWPSTRDVAYFGRVLLFLLPPQILVVAFGAPSEGDPTGALGLGLIFNLAAMLIAARYGLAFPATAIDEYRGFAAAWRALRGATLPLIGALAICLIGTGMVSSLFLLLFRGPPAEGAGGDPSMDIFLGVVTLIQTAVTVAVLSIVYRKRCGNPITNRPTSGSQPFND